MPKQTPPSLDVSRMLVELRNTFLGELPSRLDDMETIILDLGNGQNFSENFETLFRHVHSIKGSAGTHGLHIISTVCHSFEDEVVKVEGDESSMDSEVITSWLGFIDLLRTTIDKINAGVEDFSDVEANLDKSKRKDSGREYFGLLVFTPGLQQQMCLSAFKDTPVNMAFAENGYKAMGRLLHEKFDFLISNMELGDLNGFALISALRLSKTRNHNIPAILLTSKEFKGHGRESDPDYVIQKDANMLKTVSETAKKIIKVLREK